MSTHLDDIGVCPLCQKPVLVGTTHRCEEPKHSTSPYLPIQGTVANPGPKTRMILDRLDAIEGKVDVIGTGLAELLLLFQAVTEEKP